MTNPAIIRVIEKCMEKLIQIDFSNINEVKTLKEILIEYVNYDIEEHVTNHSVLSEYCDCREYDERAKFCGKLLEIINKLINKLENEN